MTDHATHIPEKRQSVRPTPRIWLALGGVLLVVVVIGLAVGWAVLHGGSDCSGHRANGGVSANCR